VEFRPKAVARQVAGSRQLRAVVGTLGLMVEREAKRRAPVDTGRLRASITTRVVPGPTGPIAETGTDVDYAPPQEFGTSKMTGRRYLGGGLMAVAARLRRRTR
jgi:bacteriophage HK97-gp10 putative tail-component